MLVKVDKTAFHVSKGILCRVFHSTKFYFFEHSMTLSAIKSNSGKKFPSCCQNCSLHVQRILSRSLSVWKLFVFFSLVFGIVKNLSAIRRKNPVRLPQLRFMWPEGSIEVKIFKTDNSFFKHLMTWLKNHQLSGKNNRGGCQNCILRVYRNILVEQLFSNIFFVFGPSAKNHQHFGKKQTEGFSKLLFPCP